MEVRACVSRCNTIYTKFWIFGDFRIETCSEKGALLHFIKREDVFAVLPTGCGKSLIFQLVPKVRSYLHDRGFSYPKAAIVVVICPFYALIDSHILELKEHVIPACSLADDDLLEDDFASHSIVFTGLELIVREEKWRKVLKSKSFLLLLKRLLSC